MHMHAFVSVCVPVHVCVCVCQCGHACMNAYGHARVGMCTCVRV